MCRCYSVTQTYSYCYVKRPCRSYDRPRHHYSRISNFNPKDVAPKGRQEIIRELAVTRTICGAIAVVVAGFARTADLKNEIVVLRFQKRVQCAYVA